jgi:hypothetical protein
MDCTFYLVDMGKLPSPGEHTLGMIGKSVNFLCVASQIMAKY